jgi:hypothetical protein
VGIAAKLFPGHPQQPPLQQRGHLKDFIATSR